MMSNECADRRLAVKSRLRMMVIAADVMGPCQSRRAGGEDDHPPQTEKRKAASAAQRHYNLEHLGKQWGRTPKRCHVQKKPDAVTNSRASPMFLFLFENVVQKTFYKSNDEPFLSSRHESRVCPQLLCWVGRVSACGAGECDAGKRVERPGVTKPAEP
ncbi:hypothetical protein BDN72DRAFT_136425 [Pluteus cervinus]|uniref:Uncharacterized protein n=1 Tax=Pluteus cervinus TaxID=181527 RepID=A0ACD3B8E3_9AGAR|nr:hypothetical protein BDN72DRAFT_136425 [Pluteus cervinus]